MKVYLDQFYTIESVAKKCIELADIKDSDIVIEPCAGEGAFSLNIDGCLALDLDPKHESIHQLNWFDYVGEHENLVIIGNPPFGNRCGLARDFIAKAIELNAQKIAFILPNVFRKPTYDKVAEGYKLTSITELPKDSFIANGLPYDVPCSFFVWEKVSDKEDLTWVRGTYTTEDFEFIKISEYDKDKHIVVKQAISNIMAGGIEMFSKSGRHFINPLRVDRDTLINIFNNIEYVGYSAVNGGVKALCQEEFIRNYNEGVVCNVESR